MWSTVESIANSLLILCFEEVSKEIPMDRLERVGSKDIDGVCEQMVEDFREYYFQVRAKFFRSIWITKPGEKLDSDIVQWRAKRYVYRFFIDRERTDDTYFWSYPLYFVGWAKVIRGKNGNTTFLEFLMYPADGTNPKWDLIELEVRNCPWYIESDQWSISFDSFEKSAFSKISKGEKIPNVLSKIKVLPSGKELQLCTRLETFV